MTHWTVEQIPDLSTKTIVVTGANSGIGYDAARELGKKGAEVILACRNQEKGRAALSQIREEVPRANVSLMALDLADLESVRTCARELHSRTTKLDILINNAGVMALPKRQTQDGFEMQFGTNHLGHFALTGLLIDLLTNTPGSRVVSVSSMAHWPGRIRFHDLNWEKSYAKWGAYGQSKLANLLFTYELNRRLKEAGKPTIAVACHPGYAATNLQATGPEMAGSKFMQGVMSLSNKIFAQDSLGGALPTLYAAVEPLAGGEYIGPGGFLETAGPPKIVRAARKASDPETAEKLWDVSEELTGVRYSWAGAGSSQQAHL